MQPFGFYENVPQTATDGIELSLAAQLERAAALRRELHAHERGESRRAAAPTSASELRRRPGETLNVEVSYLWPIRLTTTVAVSTSGRSFENVANTVELDAYMLVDLRAAYQVRETWRSTAGSRTCSTRSTRPSRATALPAAAVYAGCVQILESR